MKNHDNPLSTNLNFFSRDGLRHEFSRSLYIQYKKKILKTVKGEFNQFEETEYITVGDSYRKHEIRSEEVTLKNYALFNKNIKGQS